MATVASSSRNRRPRAVAPPPPSPDPVPCPRCDRLCTVIRLAGQDGAALTLHSCHFCEYRWWTRQEEVEPSTDLFSARQVNDAYPEQVTLIGLPDVIAATKVAKVAKADGSATPDRGANRDSAA